MKRKVVLIMVERLKKLKFLFRIKYISFFFLLLILIIIGLEVQDSYRQHGKFRTMQDSLTTAEHVDLTGLRELHSAGGPALPLSEIKERLGYNPGKLIIVDGRRTRNGYINGIPTTYFNYSQENPSLKSYLWRLVYTGTFRPLSDQVISPAEEAKRKGFGYASFEIGSKYKSTDEAVDGFVRFFDPLPKDTSVYFHCHHGKGRTSMMLVMWDIMANAPKVALKDIIKRQYLLGSVDLFDTSTWTRSTYNTKKLEERKEFIQNFYKFICQRKAGGIQEWAKWNALYVNKN